KLIDDLPEAGPRQILGGLAASEGEDAGLTLRVAAARRLHVQRARERRTERQGCDGHHAAPFSGRSAITRKAEPARRQPTTVPETFERPAIRGRCDTTTSTIRAPRAAALATISTGHP